MSNNTIAVNFDICMNAEEKKAGNSRRVKFECSFDGVPAELIQKHAIANMIVAWQSQIRGHWKEFIEGELPKVVTFGQPLFASKRVQVVKAPVTQDDIRAHIQRMVADGKSKQEIMESLGM